MRIANSDGHAPAARGQCLSCHESHGSERRGMTRREGAALCTVCHAVTKPGMSAKHQGVDLAKSNCISCHDPHIQPRGEKGLMLAAKHVPFMKGECTSCHTAQGSPQLKKTGPEMCTSCHEKGGWAGRANTHAPVKSEKHCLTCHGPHGGLSVPSLSAPSAQALCMTCHDRSGFEGKVVHKPLQKGCNSCHDAHGSDGPKLIKQRSIEDQCQSCHGDLTRHYHPTKSTRPDPEGRPLTCTSCHDPHAAEFKGLLARDPKRDLCLQCHDPNVDPAEAHRGGGHR